MLLHRDPKERMLLLRLWCCKLVWAAVPLEANTTLLTSSSMSIIHAVPKAAYRQP